MDWFISFVVGLILNENKTYTKFVGSATYRSKEAIAANRPTS